MTASASSKPTSHGAWRRRSMRREPLERLRIAPTASSARVGDGPHRVVVRRWVLVVEPTRRRRAVVPEVAPRDGVRPTGAVDPPAERPAASVAMSRRRSFGSSCGEAGASPPPGRRSRGCYSPARSRRRDPASRRSEPFKGRRGPVVDRQVGAGLLPQERPDGNRVEIRRDRQADRRQAANRRAVVELGPRETPLVVFADRQKRPLRGALPDACPSNSEPPATPATSSLSARIAA